MKVNGEFQMVGKVAVYPMDYFKIIKVVAAVLGKERYLSLKRRIKGTGTSK